MCFLEIQYTFKVALIRLFLRLYTKETINSLVVLYNFDKIFPYSSSYNTSPQSKNGFSAFVCAYNDFMKNSHIPYEPY